MILKEDVCKWLREEADTIETDIKKIEMKINCLIRSENSIYKLDKVQVLNIKMKDLRLQQMKLYEMLGRSSELSKYEVIVYEEDDRNWVEKGEEPICKDCVHRVFVDGTVGCIHPYLFNKVGDIMQKRNDEIADNISKNKCNKKEIDQ